MKLSSKGRYAIRALFDIAYYNGGRPTQVKHIVQRQGIPTRFLEQIFQELKRAAIVGSKRGPRGGYSLVQAPQTIRLGDVVRAIEGPIRLCDQRRGKRGESERATDAVLQELSASLEACFDGVTIADVCARAEALGIGRDRSQRYVYVI